MNNIFKKLSSASINAGTEVDLIVGKASEVIATHIEENYMIDVEQSSSPSHAATTIREGLHIVQREVGQKLAAQLDIIYDATQAPDEGYLISEPARLYVVNYTHSSLTPSVFLSPADNPELVVSAAPALNTIASNSMTTGTRSFSFSLPDSISVPFKLSIF